MSILVDRHSRVVVHGITGREGGFHAAQCLAYGTAIVAGMTPGKGGQRALDDRVPVFDTVAQAVAETGADTSLIFVPAPGAPDAILEAVDAGIRTIICITERIPALDMLKVMPVVRAAGAHADRPQLPRRDERRRGQGGHHPGHHPSARPGRPGQPLGDADLRGRAGPHRRVASASRPASASAATRSWAPTSWTS